MECTICKDILRSTITVILVKLAEVTKIQEKLNHQAPGNRKQCTFRLTLLCPGCDLVILRSPASLCVYLLRFMIRTDFILYNKSFFFVQLFLLPNSICILVTFACSWLHTVLSLSVVLTSALNSHRLIVFYMIPSSSLV